MKIIKIESILHAFIFLEFHTSAASDAGVQSDQKRNFEKANPPKADKYRISNNEYRSKVFCLFKKD